jgi:[glutamine synthetase] adenylyltransferase / [glutamine synthetase]-adenylyl-L-tyrosine phosphorylase
VPDILRESVARWWERALQHAALRESCEALAPARQAELLRLAAASEFAAAALIQDPEALGWLECDSSPTLAREANERYARLVAESSGAGAQRLLRQWRRREMLRIAWRDVSGAAEVPETLRSLSDLADACIRSAAAAAQNQLVRPFGRAVAPNGEQVPLIVLGMGKLGGRELNFSSDIDLVFLFAEGGTTDGERVLDNQEYFTRLGRELIKLLDARTEDGFVFRVDMRLRPFGDSGPLAVSLASLEDYLQQHGRDWERYAWIKARPILGAEAFRAANEEFVRPFVFRRYLDFGVFESLREMKALIVREVARRELEQDLKLGAGGIREAEFIVQSMQLVRGGSDRRLQNAALLEVLPLLAGSKLMSGEDVASLREAYLHLRKAENAVQMIRDEQTHGLPADASDRARLALQVGSPDWAAALERIDAARLTVATQFAALLFGAPDPQSGAGGLPLDWFGDEQADIAEELANRSFPAPTLTAVAASLATYRGAAPYRRLDEAGRRRLHVILDRLLTAAARANDPDVMVRRVLRVLEAIGARTSYLALLKEQPAALDRLIEVCAISGFLAAQIADFPLLLDELIDAKAFEDTPSREGFTRELAARTERLPADDPERQVEALRQFQKAAVFAVALSDVTGRLPLMKVSDRLTDIAELIVQCCMDLAWDQMTKIHGVPYCGESEAKCRMVKVAVAGYGKLGGLELGYGSDLDLVFLHDSHGEFQQTRAARPVDNVVFFLRLGQRIVHLLTMHSAAGRLYQVDMRLRPNGKGGFLMTGIDAFEAYQRQDAWTWEHQSLLRARAVAGDESLRARFEAARRRVLCEAVRRDTLKSDVLQMRVRMRRELSEAGPRQFDIKQDAGGIADIEFLVQYLVLAAAHEHPLLVTFSDNIRQLAGLAEVGVLDVATAEWLTGAYIGYRSVLHHQSLEGGARVVDAGAHAETRARVGQIWNEVFECRR